jgi:hypothetical protein
MNETIFLAAVWTVGFSQWIKKGIEVIWPDKVVPKLVWWLSPAVFAGAFGGLLALGLPDIVQRGLTILSVSQLGYEVIVKRIQQLAEGFSQKK